MELGINFWKNWSEVTDLPVPPFDVNGGGFGTTLGQYRIEEGKSATQIVGSDPQVDQNGTLVRDDSGAPVIVTKKLGDGKADFQMAFSNDVRLFRNWSLNFLLHWKKGETTSILPSCCSISTAPPTIMMIPTWISPHSAWRPPAWTVPKQTRKNDLPCWDSVSITLFRMHRT
ncbi:MAG: hypothetical protein R3281_01100 [Balneolaceae bacterium]|nr:hypothetical protein [Balneolaceae bacterium]